MPYPLVDMVLYFFIYSFCGWLMETVLCTVQERRFVNRGFLGGPICPIYGCAIMLILILLIPVRDGVPELSKAVAVIFLAGVVLATAVEYAVSWLMEKLFHARWWDYSHYKYNINGRVSAVISLIWGLLATAFLYMVQPGLERLVERIHTAGENIPTITAWVLVTIFIADVTISSLVALRIGNKLEQLEKWSELIRGYLESVELKTKEDILGRVEEMYERLKERGINLRSRQRKEEAVPEWHALAFDTLRSRISDYAEELRIKRESLMDGTRYLQRRMLHAFPHLKWPKRAASLHDWMAHLPVGRQSGKESSNRSRQAKETADYPSKEYKAGE